MFLGGLFYLFAQCDISLFVLALYGLRYFLAVLAKEGAGNLSEENLEK